MKIFFSFIFPFLIISSFFPTNLVNAENKCSSYTNEDSYELYKERNNCYCNDYKYNPTIINLDYIYPKIISQEEMDKIVGPIKKELDKLKKERDKIPRNTNKNRSWFGVKKNEQGESIDENGITIDQFHANLTKEVSQNKKNDANRRKFYKKIKKNKDLMKEKTKGLTTKYSLKDTKADHRKNMNSIYKCGLITSQRKALLLIKNDLINSTIKKKIEGKITSNISMYSNISDSLDCTETKNKNSVQKLILLKQATYQTCKYINYLEYLKEYNKNIQNIIEPKEGNYSPLKIAKTQNDKLSELDKEIKNTYKVFPLVFHAYTEYENNITAHLLLRLLKDDYLTLREKLHKALNPINQVVYKIVNAMKK